MLGNHFDGFILESSNRVKDEADYIKRVSAQKDRELKPNYEAAMTPEMRHFITEALLVR